MFRVILLCSSMALASSLGCRTTTGSVPGSGYRVVVVDSLTDYTHGHFDILNEIHVPEHGISFNSHEEHVNCFFTELADRRSEGDPHGREMERLQAEVYKSTCTTAVSPQLADRLLQLAELTRQRNALSKELASDEELRSVLGRVEADLGARPRTDLELQLEQLKRSNTDEADSG